MDEQNALNLRQNTTANTNNNAVCPCQQQTAATTSIADNIMYTQGYLRTQIGKLVRVQFLIGTNSLQDRTGILTQVGTSYIILRSLETGTDIFCDIYSIKFVTIANQQVGMYGGIPV